MKNKILISILLLCLTSTSLWAQIVNVKGTVTDGFDNSPLPGVAIKVKNKSVGTITDSEGNYAITADRKDVLVFSFLGMNTEERRINNQTVINVVMQSQSYMLDEFVAIGYGTMKKSDLTGSVSSIGSKDILKSAPISLEHGLQGKIAGVYVTQMDGAPGSGISIQIRGANSFSGGTDPLYVIDDIPFEPSTAPGAVSSGSQDLSQGNPLSSLNPYDVESIEVLKDASATAIYGSRGANGVVLIRTKRGKVGKPKIELNVNTGISTVAKTLDILNAEAYARYRNEARVNADIYDANAAYLLTNQLPFFDVFGNRVDYYTPEQYRNRSSDWQDMIFQTAVTADATATVSGGSENITYLVSLNAADQSGIIKSSDFQRYSLRTNLEGKLNSFLTFGVNTNLSWTNNRFVRTGSDNMAQQGGVIRSALRYPPIYSAYTSSDELADEWYDASNPLTYVTTQKNDVSGFKTVLSGYLEAKIFEDLRLRTRLGVDYSINERNQYLPSGTREAVAGRAFYGNSKYSKIVNENLLTYHKVFNKIHDFTVVGAFTAEVGKSTSRENSVSGFMNDHLQDNSMQTARELTFIRNYRAKSTLASVLGRVNYSLMDRYLFSAALRADGSSKFAKNNKWAYFPSAAIAWRVSEESFLKEVDFVSNLKIRLSYGQTGNQAISPYGSLSRISGVKYPFGGNPELGFAMNSDGLGNDNLSWETTTQYNVGLDMGFFDNRLTLTMDLYRKNTESLLQSVSLPPSTGYLRRRDNIGSMRNEGLEITLNAVPVQNKNFSWDMGFNISFNRNKVLSLGNGVQNQTVNDVSALIKPFMLVVGQPIGNIYAMKELGIYQTEQEVIDHGIYTSPDMIKFAVGEVKYQDTNQNEGEKGILNDNDRVVVGNSNPDFIFGLSQTFRYKQFDLSFLIQGVYGNDVINTLKYNFESNLGQSNNTTWKAYNNAWRGEGTSNSHPKIIESNKRVVYFSDRYVEDGSFLRLKNLNIGYNVSLKKNSLIQSLRVSFIATNLFTITDYSGYDPEVNGFGSDPLRRGVDLGNYPNCRTFSLGVNAVF